jgi:hypothetical protein
MDSKEKSVSFVHANLIVMEEVNVQKKENVNVMMGSQEKLVKRE